MRQGKRDLSKICWHPNMYLCQSRSPPVMLKLTPLSVRPVKLWKTTAFAKSFYNVNVLQLQIPIPAANQKGNVRRPKPVGPYNATPGRPYSEHFGFR